MPTEFEACICDGTNGPGLLQRHELDAAQLCAMIGADWMSCRWRPAGRPLSSAHKLLKHCRRALTELALNA